LSPQKGQHAVPPMGCNLSSSAHASRTGSAGGGAQRCTRAALEPPPPAGATSSMAPQSGAEDGARQAPFTLQVHDHGVKRTLDCKRDTADHRDWIFNVAEHSKVKGSELPSSVDLRPAEAFPLYDQGELGSCTANALCAAFHFIQRREGLEGFSPSRLFVYFNERAIEGHIRDDSGASLRDGIKSLCVWGVCDEELWPYDVSTFKKQPTPECYAAAKANRCKTYARVEQNLESLKGCIAAGFPFVFGFMVLCDFMAGDVQSTGVMEWPPKGMPHGGHAVQACGYDDAKQCFIVRNSWGEQWGEKGHFHMPYAFITHPQLCHDFWAIVLVEGAEFPTKRGVAKSLAEEAADGTARAPMGGA
jgi:C1A family cysteine protease